MSLRLAAQHAATNCARHGATVHVTTKSGLEFSGKLDKPERPLEGEDATLHIRTLGLVTGQQQGWSTILFSEVAAISVRRG